MKRIPVTQFADLEAEFIQRVHSMVWCNAATVDQHHRPRSRILHPIWEGATGWIGTRRDSYKATHLAHNPHLSLAYIGDIAKPVYVDCTAEWVEELTERGRIWNLYASAPPPLGYDPTPIFQTLTGFGLLRLTPWRIEVADFPTSTRVWHL